MILILCYDLILLRMNHVLINSSTLYNIILKNLAYWHNSFIVFSRSICIIYSILLCILIAFNFPTDPFALIIIWAMFKLCIIIWGALMIIAFIVILTIIEQVLNLRLLIYSIWCLLQWWFWYLINRSFGKLKYFFF